MIFYCLYSLCINPEDILSCVVLQCQTALIFSLIGASVYIGSSCLVCYARKGLFYYISYLNNSNKNIRVFDSSKDVCNSNCQ